MSALRTVYNGTSATSLKWCLQNKNRRTLNVIPKPGEIQHRAFIRVPALFQKQNSRTFQDIIDTNSRTFSRTNMPFRYVMPDIIDEYDIRFLHLQIIPSLLIIGSNN